LSNLILNGLVNGILYGGGLALLAVGMNLIFGVLNVIHLAYGQCVMVALYAVYVFAVLLHLPLLVSSVIAVGISGLVALLIHAAVVNPLLKAPLINQLLALAGVMIVLENIVLAVFGSDYLGIQISFPVFSVGDVYIRISSLVPFGVGIATLALLWLFLNRTYTGLAIRAIVQDRDMAELMGVRTGRVYWITFGIGGILAGVVAACFAPIYTVHPHFGAGFTLTAFVIVVLGGLGNLLGGTIAAFLIGVISQVTGVVFTSEIGEILVYAIFVIFILFRPQGLLGARANT
jgi:branched-chain amino acid transport system permease protein